MNSQCIESVLELLKYRKLPTAPLPESIELPGLMLVLSNKKDVYYVVTDVGCSCPSASYRPGQRCKHQRKYYPKVKAAREDAECEPLMFKPESSFKPFLE